MNHFRLILALAAGLLASAPALARAQESNLLVPPSMRAPTADTGAKQVQPVKKAKKATTGKVVSKLQNPSALPTSSARKTDDNPVSLDMKWKAESGSGGSAAAGSYNPWFYKGSSSSSQVEGGLKFGF